MPNTSAVNHPRRGRQRRLLLLAPLLLLGATLLIRSRLPHPQTEGDKWLWEVAESVPSLSCQLGPQRQALKVKRNPSYLTPDTIDLKNRTGIRNLLHSLQGTPAFAPLRSSLSKNDGKRVWTTVVTISFEPEDECLRLTHEPQGYFLYRESTQRLLPPTTPGTGDSQLRTSNVLDVAPVSQQEFIHFRAGLYAAMDKASQQADGYSLEWEQTSEQ